MGNQRHGRHSYLTCLVDRPTEYGGGRGIMDHSGKFGSTWMDCDDTEIRLDTPSFLALRLESA